MTKQTGIYVDGEGWMTVTAYEAMLRGQLRDAVRVLADYEAKGEAWSQEAIQYASFALPDGPAFDNEVLDAEKSGAISGRSASRLYKVAEEVWQEFALMIVEATGKTLAELEADSGMWDTSTTITTNQASDVQAVAGA